MAVKIVDVLGSLHRMGGLPTEAALMQGLQHPCIVALLEHKVRGPPSDPSLQRLWMILQLCNKGTLEVRLLI